MYRKALKRGAEPARRVFGAALFDAIPKAVLGRVAYELARHGDGVDVGDQAAKRRVLELWDRLEPEGLPLPSPNERAALAGDGAETFEQVTTEKAWNRLEPFLAQADAVAVARRTRGR